MKTLKSPHLLTCLALMIPLWVAGQKTANIIGFVEPINWGNQIMDFGILVKTNEKPIAIRLNASHYSDRGQLENFDFRTRESAFSAGLVYYPFFSPVESLGARCPSDHTFWIRRLLKGTYVSIGAFYESARITYTAKRLLQSEDYPLVVATPGVSLSVGKHVQIGPFFLGLGGGLLTSIPQVKGLKEIIDPKTFYNFEFPFRGKLQLVSTIEIGIQFKI